jgi:hypothetical protein
MAVFFPSKRFSLYLTNFGFCRQFSNQSGPRIRKGFQLKKILTLSGATIAGSALLWIAHHEQIRMPSVYAATAKIKSKVIQIHSIFNVTS